MQPCLMISKVIFSSILFAIFAILFGQPAFERYIDDSVVIKSSKNPSKPSLDAPALTICVDQSKSWKKYDMSNTYTSVEASIVGECNFPRTAKNIVNCMEEQFYSHNEMVDNVIWKQVHLEDGNLWNSDISQVQ